MEGNDVLTGGAGDTPDFLIGGSGRDRLSGGAGSDLLIGHQVGGESDATILGTSLNQWIASPTGIPANLNFFTPDNVQDQLIGGSGNDLLEGEPGDVFRQ
jgi:Ca2+-binding RTX toxin-like protein